MSGGIGIWTRNWCGRGKDEQDWSDLVVSAPPLYIQEKVQPKVIIDDLVASDLWRVARGEQGTNHQPPTTQLELDLFADFNGLPEEATGTDFYQPRWPLVESDGFGRQLAGDGEFGGAGGVAGESAQVKLYSRVGNTHDTLYHYSIDLKAIHPNGGQC